MEYRVLFLIQSCILEVRTKLLGGMEKNSVAEPKIFISASAPGSTEPQIRISAPAPALAPESFIRYFENYIFDLSNRIKIVQLTKTSWWTMIFSLKFLQVCGK